MGGSMARKESRAPNGHPAELKKEEETAYLREHPGFPQKAKKTCRRSNAAPQNMLQQKEKHCTSCEVQCFFGGE